MPRLVIRLADLVDGRLDVRVVGEGFTPTGETAVLLDPEAGSVLRGDVEAVRDRARDFLRELLTNGLDCGEVLYAIDDAQTAAMYIEDLSAGVDVRIDSSGVHYIA